MSTNTIAAIATGMTNSGIGIIRISGEDSFSVIDRIYKSSLIGKSKVLSECSSHTVHYGYICDGDEVVDEVMVVLMRAPRSYTKEDTIEINCHGGVYVMDRVLQTVIKYGARPAEPGEFTKRAFLNGRIDLAQAESVIDVINSKNQYALQSSISQLRGFISEDVRRIRAELLHEIAYIESALDDPEHISLDGYREQLILTIDREMEQINRILQNSENGRMLKEGIRTVILGKPNAGKSSLLNRMAGEERAIVTDVAGTTRDTLEEAVSFYGFTLIIIDTAGIHDTEDKVEQIGIERARKAAESADLILYVMDSSTLPDENDREILELIQSRANDKNYIVLLNKSDLPSVTSLEDAEKFVCGHVISAETGEDISNFTGSPVISFSAETGEGFSELEKTIRSMLFHGKVQFNEEVYLTNMRQKTAIENAYHSLTLVKESIDRGMPEDFYSIDLMDAYESLGKVIGESVGDDLVNEIFSKFCMGK